MLSGSIILSSGLPAPRMERSDFGDLEWGGKEDYQSFISGDEEEIPSIRVNKRTALGYAPMLRAVTLIGSDMGVMPIHILKRTQTKWGEGLERDRKHQANFINTRPNKLMTRYPFIQTLFAHAVYRGNGFGLVLRDGGGRPHETLLLDPTTTWAIKRNGEKWIISMINGKLHKFPSEDVIHIRGLGDNGLEGYDILTLGRKTLGLALATREHRVNYFKNGARPSVILECPGRLPKKVMTQIKENWGKLYTGVNNHHRTAILQMGTSAKVLSQSARDSQLLEGQEHDVFHVSALTGVPPHKIGGKGRQSWGSMEQENESYLADCLSHWMTCGSQELSDKLLTEKEKANDTHVIEFQSAAKVKANLLTRFQAYELALRSQWMVPNEVRAREGLNPIEGGEKPVDYQKSAKETNGNESSAFTKEEINALIKKALDELKAEE